MAETGSCVLAAGAATLASYGLGQVCVWALRLPTRSVWENLTLSSALGLALGSVALALTGSVSALSIEAVELLTLGLAAVGVWGLAACWLRMRITQPTSQSIAEGRWPATGRPVLTLAPLAAGAALVQALAPPLRDTPFAAEIWRSIQSLRSAEVNALEFSESALTASFVLGGPGACSVFRWLLAVFAAAAAGLAVEFPGRRLSSERHSTRVIAVALAIASPIACRADQTATGLLVGGWLAVAWFAWQRSLCEPAGARWRILACAVGGAALLSVFLAMRRAPQPAQFSSLELLSSLGPLLASSAAVSILVLGCRQSSTAVLGTFVLAIGSSRGVGPQAAGWAAPLLAAAVAQGVAAFDDFRWPVRRWAAGALAAAFAVQSALPLVAARGVWAVALGHEERDQYLGKRIPEFRAVRLLDAMARRNSLVYSDQDELLYYDGPSLQANSPAAAWSPEELARPIYLLHVDPPPGSGAAQRWLAARQLSLGDPRLTYLLDYEFDDGRGVPRRYRLVRIAPEAARELAAAPDGSAMQTAGQRAPNADLELR